jgi:hypothetical protein
MSRIPRNFSAVLRIGTKALCRLTSIILNSEAPRVPAASPDYPTGRRAPKRTMMFRKHDSVAARPEEVRMRFQSVFAVVGALLIAAPGIGNAAQRSDRIDALRQIAIDVGRVIGAASVCREITWPRVKALTDGLSDLIKASVTHGESFPQSNRHMIKAPSKASLP